MQGLVTEEMMLVMCELLIVSLQLSTNLKVCKYKIFIKNRFSCLMGDLKP